MYKICSKLGPRIRSHLAPWDWMESLVFIFFRSLAVKLPRGRQPTCHQGIAGPLTVIQAKQLKRIPLHPPVPNLVRFRTSSRPPLANPNLFILIVGNLSCLLMSNPWGVPSLQLLLPILLVTINAREPVE